MAPNSNQVKEKDAHREAGFSYSLMHCDNDLRKIKKEEDICRCPLFASRYDVYTDENHNDRDYAGGPN